jgi:hypothetical protein
VAALGVLAVPGHRLHRLGELVAHLVGVHVAGGKAKQRGHGLVQRALQAVHVVHVRLAAGRDGDQQHAAAVRQPAGDEVAAAGVLEGLDLLAGDRAVAQPAVYRPLAFLASQLGDLLDRAAVLLQRVVLAQLDRLAQAARVDRPPIAARHWHPP